MTTRGQKGKIRVNKSQETQRRILKLQYTQKQFTV